MIYSNPAMFVAAFFVVWALATSFALRHMAEESDCFDKGIVRSGMFIFAATAWSALCGILAALLVEFVAGMAHLAFN